MGQVLFVPFKLISITRELQNKIGVILDLEQSESVGDLSWKADVLLVRSLIQEIPELLTTFTLEDDEADLFG